MVDTKHKVCAYPGCSLLPSMNDSTSRAKRKKGSAASRASNLRAVYCVSHAPEDSVNVTGSRCLHPGCSVQRTFGLEGAKEGALFCAKHRSRDMSDVRNPRCHVHGCVSQPRYGREGDPRASFCLRHAEPDMVDIR